MRITLIGTGKVAAQLAPRLLACGHELVELVGRSEAQTQTLANQLGVSYQLRLESLNPSADVYLIAVQDRNIPEIAAQIAYLAAYDKIVAHTSGTVAVGALSQYFEQAGVFYPLQTFSNAQAVDFLQLPFCIHSPNPKTCAFLEVLAKSIGNPERVYCLDDAGRGRLHVAAVFVNNFVNHLYEQAYRFCEAEQIPFGLLLPLIQETARKVETARPAQVQTGPAQRADQSTIDRHLNLLQAYPDHSAIYELLTRLIQKK